MELNVYHLCPVQTRLTKDMTTTVHHVGLSTGEMTDYTSHMICYTVHKFIITSTITTVGRSFHNLIKQTVNILHAQMSLVGKRGR